MAPPIDDPFDPDNLRMEIPTRALDTPTRKRQRIKRGLLFIPPVPWPEFVAVMSKLSTTRAVRLWGILKMQRKLERVEWFIPRSNFLRAAGLYSQSRMVLYRAVKELEAAGLVAVHRRPGRPVELKLLPVLTKEGATDGGNGPVA
jgi:hypothetical protein